MIRIQGLRKSFGSLEVLKGIDYDVKAQEVICIIGASGSGKSTFLRCINQLENVTAGAVYIEGVDITDPESDINEMRAEVGVVLLQVNLFLHMNMLVIIM